MQNPFITAPRLAVLIDAENISPAWSAQLMAQVAERGAATIRRAYADWTSPYLASWKKPLNALAIRPCQQFNYTRRKNATDSALIMDAMELLHARERRVDGFCIVSSDSDYTGLAGRIREQPVPLVAQQLMAPMLLHLFLRPAAEESGIVEFPGIGGVCNTFADNAIRAVATREDETGRGTG